METPQQTGIRSNKMMMMLLQGKFQTIEMSALMTHV
jgi:hypothetical protein